MLRRVRETWSRVAIALALSTVTVGCGLTDPPLARWHLAEDPSPDDETLALLVNEIECASGQSAEGRIAEPAVRYREDAVVITVRVERRSDSETCPGNPDTPYTLELAEPVGTRTLVDGGLTPPAGPQPGEG